MPTAATLRPRPVSPPPSATRWARTIQDHATSLVQAVASRVNGSGRAHVRYRTPASAWPADARLADARPSDASPAGGRKGAAEDGCQGESLLLSADTGSTADAPLAPGRPGATVASNVRGDDRGRYLTELVVTTTCTGDAQEDVTTEVEAVLGLPVETERTSDGHLVVRSAWEAAAPPDAVFADLAMRSLLSGVMCNATGQAAAEVRVVSYDREAVRRPWSERGRAPRPVFERRIGQASRRSSSVAAC